MTLTARSTLGWGDATLGELIADVKTGFASGERAADGVIQVRMNNLDTEGNLDLTKATRVPAPNGTVKEFQLEPGDVLFNNTNSTELVGKSAIFPGYPEPVVFSNHFTRLRTNRSVLDPQYLTRWLTRQQRARVFEGLCNRWVNQSAVRKEALLGLTIPLPYPDDPKCSLAEQKRIAAILDKADAIRRRRQEATRVSEELIPSLFYGMFGDLSTNKREWPIEPLSQLVDPEDKINYGVVQPGNDFAGGVPIVRVGDFANMRIRREGLKTIDPGIESQYRRSRLHGDEVLVACVGSIGLIALADEGLCGHNIVRAVARIRCGPRLDRIFLAYYLATPRIQAYFGQETRTVSQPTLNIKQIELTPTFRPPIELQHEFSRRAHAIDSLRERHDSQAHEADELFNSLVQRAFRGDL